MRSAADRSSEFEAFRSFAPVVCSVPMTVTVAAERRLRPHWRLWHWLPAVIGLASVLYGLWSLLGMEAGVEVSRDRAAGIPVTLFRPANQVPGPAVVIAHGFAGSRQLMRSFAVNLARNGYLAVTFDFPGHGDHREPLGGSLGSPERLTSLLDALTEVVAFSREQPHSGGVALLGHSMAGDIMVRYAETHPEVGAIVAVSPYLSEPVQSSFEPDLLFVYGAYEPEMIQRQGREAVAGRTSEPVQLDITYGEPAQGSARRMVLAEGVEHIGVLFSAHAQREAIDWLDASFGRRPLQESPAREIVIAAGGLGWLYAGLLLLAWPLSLRLPAMAARPLGASLKWPRFILVALFPAILTPVLLWPVPNDFLPLLIGDYLALHFLVYGLLTYAVLASVGRLPGWQKSDQDRQQPSQGTATWSIVLGTIAWLGYGVLGFGWPTDAFVASFFPVIERTPTVLVLFVAAFVYTSADAWLVHGPDAARGGTLVTKLLFLLSLMLAVVLNLDELFFLVIIVPAMLLLFVVYGLLDYFSYRRSWQPFLGASVSALVFSLAITATFPTVA